MYLLYLLSLLSGSQSRLNTVQVLTPIMAREDKETLVALAINGIINWREIDRENTDKRARTHTYICQNSHLLFWTRSSCCVSQMCTSAWQFCCAV